LHAVAHFENFEADLGAGELRKAGVRIKLHDQRVRVLVMLCCWTGREGPLMPWQMGSAQSQGNFQLQNHDGNDDGEHSVTESLDTAFSHLRSATFQAGVNGS
jgi:hypothetical protein